jgi:methylphosphotriester-DNA--protein-cysteine methyltransferase
MKRCQPFSEENSPDDPIVRMAIALALQHALEDHEKTELLKDPET